MADLSHLVELTQELMRFRSTASRPKEIDAIVDRASAYFDGTGLTVERHASHGIPSLFVSKLGNKMPKVLLCGHLDVVEGTDEQFSPRIEGDKLFGRGAQDMKSGNACMMALMKDLARSKQDIGLMLTGDEEIGGENGVGYLIGKGYGGQVVVLPDGGEAVLQMVSKEKGVLRLRLISHGVAAHGSMPWLGTNAIELLSKSILAIQDGFMPFDDHPADHWVTTCNIGTIRGGTAVNSVPSYAEAMLDIRFVEQDDVDKLIERVSVMLPEGVTVEVEHSSPGNVVPHDNPLIAAFRQATKKVTGKELKDVLEHGSSDAGYFAPLNAFCIQSQPDGGNTHAADEWVSISSIGVYYDIIRTYAETIA